MDASVADLVSSGSAAAIARPSRTGSEPRRPAESAVRADVRAAAARPRLQSPPGPLTRYRLCSLPHAGNKKPLGNHRQGLVLMARHSRWLQASASSQRPKRFSSDYTNMFDAAALRASMSPVRIPPTRGRKGRVEYSSATRCQEHACGVRILSAATPRKPPARRRSRASGSSSPLPHHDLSEEIGDCTIRLTELAPRDQLIHQTLQLALGDFLREVRVQHG